MDRHLLTLLALIEVQFGFKEAIWVKPLADATTTTQGSLSIPPKLLWICCCPSKQDKWHNLLSFFAAKVKTCNLAMARVKRFLFKASLFFQGIERLVWGAGVVLFKLVSLLIFRHLIRFNCFLLRFYPFSGIWIKKGKWKNILTLGFDLLKLPRVPSAKFHFLVILTSNG